MTDLYGTKETNPLDPKQREFAMTATERVYWNDPRLARVTRLRLLSDPGFPMWDVSYCNGILKNGDACIVDLPFFQLDRSHRAYGKYVRKPSIRSQIIEYAKRDRVYAKGLGILDNISTLV